MQNNSQTPAPNPAMLKILWGALTVSHFFYVFLAYTTPMAAAEAPAASQVAQVISVIAVVAGAISFLLSRKMLSSEAISRAFEEKKPVARALGAVFTVYIVCWALNEAVTLFGFVLAFTLLKAPNVMLPFLAGGVLLNLLMFPRVEEPFRQAREREGIIS